MDGGEGEPAEVRQPRGGRRRAGRVPGARALSLGVEGKLSLWVALKTVADDYPALEPAQLDRLIERAADQRAILERERVAAGRQALRRDDASS